MGKPLSPGISTVNSRVPRRDEADLKLRNIQSEVGPQIDRVAHGVKNKFQPCLDLSLAEAPNILFLSIALSRYNHRTKNAQCNPLGAGDTNMSGLVYDAPTTGRSPDNSQRTVVTTPTMSTQHPRAPSRPPRSTKKM